MIIKFIIIDAYITFVSVCGHVFLENGKELWSLWFSQKVPHLS